MLSMRDIIRIVEAEMTSRKKRIAMLRAELNDKRRLKALKSDLHTENLRAWIDHLERMSDEDYERDRQHMTADEVAMIKSGIHLAGRDHHPEDVLAGINWNSKQVHRARQERLKRDS